MQWVVPFIMGAWAALTWAHSQDQARRKERFRLTALYVTPFMSACEDLQSRIYKLLELDTISYYDFKERLNSAPLKDSQSVQQSLETLREARSAQKIVGRERLAEAQRHLAELLSYLEDQEGYTLFHGARLTCSGY